MTSLLCAYNNAYGYVNDDINSDTSLNHHNNHRNVGIINESPTMYGVISGDNRLRIYDTMSSKLLHQLYVSNHLSERYTCVSFSVDKQYIGVGCANGDIILWNLADTKSKRFHCHNESVNDLIIHNERIYTVSNDKHIAIWSLKDGKLIHKWQVSKQKVVKVAIFDKFILTATSSIKLWRYNDNKSPELLCKYAGHSSHVNILMFNNDGKMFISGSSLSDRFINIWSTQTNTKKCRTPLVSLKLDAPPIHASISFHLFNKKKNFNIMSLSNNNIIHQWCVNTLALQQERKDNDETKMKPLKSTTQISLSNITMNDKIQQIAYSNDNAYIHIVRGSNALPVFQRISFMNKETGDAHDTIKLSPLSSSSSSSVLEKDRKRKMMMNDDVNVVGLSDLPTIEEPPRKQAKPSTTGGDDEEEEEKDEDGGITLSEALEQWNKTHQQQKQTLNLNGNLNVISSLQTVLSQALHTNDRSMLDFCLLHDQNSVIKSTLTRLPSNDILALLKVLVNEMKCNPHRSELICKWIQELLAQHLGYLLNHHKDILKQYLMPLRTTIDYRLSSFKKLLQLQGRLQLLLSQVKHTNTNDDDVQTTSAITMIEQDDHNMAIVEDNE